VKRQLNRFSRFVTSGAEEFILYGGRCNTQPANNMVALQHIYEEEGVNSGGNGGGFGNGADANSVPSESDKHYIEVGEMIIHMYNIDFIILEWSFLAAQSTRVPCKSA
jgi:hypothetical protein